MRYVTAIPAYGRDYKSANAVREAWYSGKDFYIQDIEYKGYISKANKPTDITLIIRYAQLRREVIIT